MKILKLIEQYPGASTAIAAALAFTCAAGVRGQTQLALLGVCIMGILLTRLWWQKLLHTADVWWQRTYRKYFQYPRRILWRRMMSPLWQPRL